MTELSTKAPALLRYRFDTLAQLLAHLHAVEERSLLFFRGTPELAEETPVLLEVCMSDTGQTRVLRGSVAVRTDGGSWLAIQSGIVRELHRVGMPVRRSARIATELPVELHRGSRVDLGRLVDVSMGGCKVIGPAELTKGISVEVKLHGGGVQLASSLGRAVAVWQKGEEIGLQFERGSEQSRLAVSRLYHRLQREWQVPRYVLHAQSCCRGQLLDPPPPGTLDRARWRLG